ncbi:MAG: hypothetical protein HY558_01005 [Euryarchaeota archaeon]|nr:hypothetical protein [Euryarchaeota archaeon]
MKGLPPLLLLLLLLAPPALGVRLEGRAYDYSNLDPIDWAIIEVYQNTTLQQRKVAEKGTYSFNLTPGSYRIVARLLRGATVELQTEENLTLREDRTHDLILLPLLDIEEGLLPPNLSIETLGETRAPPASRRPSTLPPLILAAAIAAALGALLGWRWWRRRPSPAPAPPPSGLPEDLQAALRILQEAGGRMNQKDLRRRLGYSEAKVSLLVADMEERKLLRKVKRGRGNILMLEKHPEASESGRKVS